MPEGLFTGNETNNANERDEVMKPNWREADQLAN